MSYDDRLAEGFEMLDDDYEAGSEVAEHDGTVESISIVDADELFETE